jgi:hypothetical protein
MFPARSSAAVPHVHLSLRALTLTGDPRTCMSTGDMPPPPSAPKTGVTGAQPSGALLLTQPSPPLARRRGLFGRSRSREGFCILAR